MGGEGKDEAQIVLSDICRTLDFEGGHDSIIASTPKICRYCFLWYLGQVASLKVAHDESKYL